MDFGKRISDAQGSANASKQSYNQYEKEAGSAGEKYNSAFDGRQNYGDIYADARNEYMNTDEINAARGTYQGARDAVDQMNTTMNKLPESIRQQYGGTGLTEAQRSRAMGDQQSQMSNTANYLGTNYQNAATDYNDLSNRALQEVFNVSGGNYQSQEDGLNALQSAWSTLLNQRNTAYGQNQADRGLLANEQGAQDNWKLKQELMDLDRWKEQQANVRAAADRDTEMDIEKYLGASKERIAGMQFKQPTKGSYQDAVAPTPQQGGGNWLVDNFKNGADSWGKTWNNNGAMTLLGKGTFY
jgi:hypothetical protein